MSALGRWQLAIAILILLLIATAGGFYTYARHRAQKALRDLPGKLAANIAQKALGFTYSKSEGGRTLFTIKATELIQFKDGVHAELHNVSILVFGRESDRYDHIYGNKFSYDQKTQEVRADGPVSIDLETQAAQADPSKEAQSQIRLRTSGLVFSQATGIAQTSEKIEFHTPEGQGTAIGVIYDTHSGAVHLQHDVRLIAYAGASPQTIAAASAVFTQSTSPTRGKVRLAQLEDVTMRDSEREMKAPQLDIFLHADNTVDRVVADHGIASRSLNGPENSISANSAVFLAGPKNQITRADLRGNVHVASERTTADSGAATLHLTGQSSLESVDLSDGATLRQPDGSQIQSQALHLALRPTGNRSLARATTFTPATITLLQPGAHTTISANRMDAVFNDASQIESLHAAPNVRVVSRPAGAKAPQRVTTSDALDATFTTTANQPALARIVESGKVTITEGARTAAANRADYDPRTQRALLTGSPRLADHDSATGMSVSALRIEIDSANNHALAQGDVRVTYLPSTAQPPGAAGMFSGSGPTHAIASSASLNQAEDGQAKNKTSNDAVLTLTGSPARLWQGANILEAPQIAFDRDRRSLIATGSISLPVTTSFVQQQQQGSSSKLVPVTVTAQALHYSDEGRRANFDHNVVVRGEDSTISAQQLTVVLYPAAKPTDQSAKKAPPATSGQIDQIIATGSIKLDQPGRRAAGERLLYNSQDAKFVLTGTPNSPPSIFDAEHGSVTGDSLTFYSRDDRVLVESHGKRTITHTKLLSAK